MRVFTIIKRAAENPLVVLTFFARHSPFKYCLSDECFVRLFYRAYQHRRLNLEDPKAFSEKIQWLKLYDHDPRYTQLSDKYLVRDYVKERIGEQYLIPLLGQWKRVEDIDFAKLPQQFVLKCNHDSGSVVFCTDKTTIREKDLRKLKRRLNYNYYWSSREHNYKDIDRRIIAEKYMADQNGELQDYKFFCFDGVPRFIQVDKGRFGNHTRDFFTTELEFIPVREIYPNCGDRPDLSPETLQQMLQIASKLSEGLCHARVDLYYADGKIYFGEMTLHHATGGEMITPFEYDLLWGSYLHLPEKQECLQTSGD